MWLLLADNYKEGGVAMRKPSRFRMLRQTGLICLALAVPGTAFAAPCAARADQTALQVRMLQTELMVGALTCNQRTDYNAFVNRFQPQLASQGKHLQAFFKQGHGAKATRELNDFVTRIANESARRGMVKRGAFCRGTDRIHADAKTLAAAELPRFASQQEFSQMHGITPCLTKVAQKTATK